MDVGRPNDRAGAEGLEIALGVFLKGVGMEVLWPQALALGGQGAGLFALGLWRFGRQLG